MYLYFPTFQLSWWQAAGWSCRRWRLQPRRCCCRSSSRRGSSWTWSCWSLSSSEDHFGKNAQNWKLPRHIHADKDDGAFDKVRVCEAGAPLVCIGTLGNDGNDCISLQHYTHLSMKEMDMLGRRWGRVALKRSVGIQFVCSTLEGDFFIKSDFGSNFDTLCMVKRNSALLRLS